MHIFIEVVVAIFASNCKNIICKSRVKFAVIENKNQIFIMFIINKYAVPVQIKTLLY